MYGLEGTAMIGTRGIAVLLALATLVIMGAPAATRAQSWPVKPVRLVVPFTPGALTDVVTRLVADKLGPRLGQTVIVENKPGAGGDVGAALVAKSPADGYTVLVANHPGFTTAPALSKDPGFDPVRDFAPIAGLVRFSMLLAVHPSVPVNTLPEFVAYAKARPGQLNFASPGVGMPHNLAMEMFKQTAGVNLVHVLYKGGAMATQDLIGGRVQAMFGSWVIFGPHVQSGRLKAIGVSSAARLPQAPEVRSIAEQGYPGFDVWSWTGLLAPAGTPPEAIARLTEEAQAVLATFEIKERLLALGLDPVPAISSAAFGEQIKADVAQWARIIRDANIKTE